MDERRIAGMLVLVAGQLLTAGQCRADAWQHALSSRVSAEYETNPAMTQSNSGGVWRGVFDPSYTLTGRIGENSITSGIALQMARASNKMLSPDRDSPSAFINWLHPGESGEYGVSGRYAEIATRDAGGVDATGRIPASSTSASRTLSGRWSNEMSERSTFAVDAAYERVSYTGGTYTDYSTRSGGARLGYVLSEQTTTFGRLSGNKYTPVNGGPSSSLVDATLGANWLGEFVNWSMQIGKTRFGSGRTDTQGSAELTHTSQKTVVTLSAGRSVTPSGMGGFIKSDQTRGSWSYTLSEYTTTGIYLERRKTLPTDQSVSGTNTTSGAWMEYTLSSLWRMRTSYLHRASQGGSVNASSNMLGISFTYLNPDF